MKINIYGEVVWRLILTISDPRLNGGYKYCFKGAVKVKCTKSEDRYTPDTRSTFDLAVMASVSKGLRDK